METAAYQYLNLTLTKQQALMLYYQLTSYLRETDKTSFGKLMAFNDGTLSDRALLYFVFELMASEHPQAFAHFVDAVKPTAL